MPLCGTKKNKKQRRDPSPPYGRKNDVEDREGLVQSARIRELEDAKTRLEADLEKERKSNQRLHDENRKLKADLKRERERENENKTEEKVTKATKSDLPHHADKPDSGQENGKLSEELQTSKKELEKTRQELTDKDDQIKRLHKDLGDAQQAVLSAKRAIEEAPKGEADALRQVQEQLDAKITDIAKLTEDLKKTRTQLDAERTRVGTLEQESGKLKREKDFGENELERTRKELEIARKESHIPRSPTRALSDEGKAKIEAAEAELKKERDQRLEKEKEITRLNNSSDLLQKDKEILEKTMAQLQLQVQQLQARLDESQSALKNLEMNKKNDTKRLEDMTEGFKKKLDESEQAKEKLLSRLSSQTAAHVLDNNPNVSDLSDPNRPQKLGEQLAQVYDDQWTDATEALEKLNKNEEGILKILLDLIVFIYKHCKEAADSQLSRIEEDLLLPPLESPTSPTADANDQESSKNLTSSKLSSSKIPRFTSHKGRPALPNVSSEKKTIDNEPSGTRDKDTAKRSLSASVKGEKLPEVPTEVRKGIKEYRKRVTKQVWPVIEKEVLTKLRKDGEFDDDVIEACASYIKKCVELCWLMRVQDPPVCLIWDVPDDRSFDSDIYRAYTKSGNHVEYVVWPAMYLYEGGPILMKGVAQGSKK